jgi:3-hydroxyacyl-[acyl-carrier-protein] dehydratase
MAQVGGLLLLEEADPDGPRQIFYLAGMQNVRWRRPVIPGDQLLIRANILKARRRVFRVAVEARVDGELATSAEITCQLAPETGGDLG